MIVFTFKHAMARNVAVNASNVEDYLAVPFMNQIVHVNL